MLAGSGPLDQSGRVIGFVLLGWLGLAWLGVAGVGIVAWRRLK
jgi:hypothetical protein